MDAVDQSVTSQRLTSPSCPPEQMEAVGQPVTTHRPAVQVPSAVVKRCALSALRHHDGQTVHGQTVHGQTVRSLRLWVQPRSNSAWSKCTCMRVRACVRVCVVCVCVWACAPGCILGQSVCFCAYVREYACARTCVCACVRACARLVHRHASTPTRTHMHARTRGPSGRDLVGVRVPLRAMPWGSESGNRLYGEGCPRVEGWGFETPPRKGAEPMAA